MVDTDPIAYEVLQKGTPVVTATGTEIGPVEHVLADASLDLFDGIVVKTGEGLRFVTADQVGLITVGAVHTKIADADVANLQKPHTGNQVLEANPDEYDGNLISKYFGKLFMREHWTRPKDED